MRRALRRAARWLAAAGALGLASPVLAGTPLDAAGTPRYRAISQASDFSPWDGKLVTPVSTDSVFAHRQISARGESPEESPPSIWTAPASAAPAPKETKFAVDLSSVPPVPASWSETPAPSNKARPVTPSLGGPILHTGAIVTVPAVVIPATPKAASSEPVKQNEVKAPATAQGKRSNKRERTQFASQSAISPRKSEIGTLALPEAPAPLKPAPMAPRIFHAANTTPVTPLPPAPPPEPTPRKLVGSVQPTHEVAPPTIPAREMRRTDVANLTGPHSWQPGHAAPAPPSNGQGWPAAHATRAPHEVAVNSGVITFEEDPSSAPAVTVVRPVSLKQQPVTVGLERDVKSATVVHPVAMKQEPRDKVAQFASASRPPEAPKPLPPHVETAPLVTMMAPYSAGQLRRRIEAVCKDIAWDVQVNALPQSQLKVELRVANAEQERALQMKLAQLPELTSSNVHLVVRIEARKAG